MPPNVTESALQAFRSVVVGAVVPASGGMSVAHLYEHPINAAVEPAHMSHVPGGYGEDQVEWGELSPPHPLRIRVSNTGDRALLLEAGTLFAGGMSQRISAAATVVEPARPAMISVLPMGARWWFEDRSSVDLLRSPILTALAFLAVLSRPPSSGQARSMLRTLSGIEAGDENTIPAAAAGSLLIDADGIAAAWVRKRPRHPFSAQDVVGRDGVQAPSSAAALLEAGVAGGSFDWHAMDDVGGRSGVVVALRSCLDIGWTFEPVLNAVT